MSEPLLDASASVRTVDDFKQWVRQRIRPVLPHEAALFGLGHLHGGGVSIDYVVTVDFPSEHLQAIRNRAGGIDSPVLRRWLETEEPQVFEADRPWPDVPPAWLESFRRYDLRNVITHAYADDARCLGSYHSFYRIPGRPGVRHIEMLTSLMSLMHELLCRVIEHHRCENLFAARLELLGERERAVVRWVGLGKTNAEIAEIVGMSESTVKHHLTSIFDKLGVGKRAQLVRVLAEHETKNSPGYNTKLL